GAVIGGFIALVFLARHYRMRRSEEHTSELQSRQYLVCRLLLEKKKEQNRPVRARSASTQTKRSGAFCRSSSIWSVPLSRSRSTPIARFFFHETATTEIYTLSLHDALPI